jgi:hypothetical protein
VIEWAGKVYSFVCDTIAAIGKALSWVFAKIKVAIEKLIDFIGFIFKWGDILQFSDSIVTYVNVCLEYGEDQIEALDDKAKTFIDDLRKQLKNRVQPDAVSANTTTKDTSATADTDDVKHGVGYNWSTYQLNHGGFQKDSSMAISSPLSDDQDALKDIWNDFVNEIGVVTKMVNDIASTLCAMFDANTNSADLFAVLTDDMIDALCDSLQNIVDIALKSIVLVMQKFNDLGSHVIEIPVLTALWKLISQGRDFTVFNFVALVMAIPATVLYKLINDRPLPALAGRLTKDDFGKFLNGDSSLDSTLVQDIQTVRSVSAVAVGFILFEVTALTFAIDELVGDGGSKAISMASKAGARRRNFVGPSILVDEKIGNAIDAGTLIMTGVSLFATWPLNYGHDVDLHSWVSKTNPSCLMPQMMLTTHSSYSNRSGVWI